MILKNKSLHKLARKTGFDNDALTKAIIDKHSIFEFLALISL